MGIPGEDWDCVNLLDMPTCHNRCRSGGREWKCEKGHWVSILLWPNFVGSEEAPTTAKYG